MIKSVFFLFLFFLVISCTSDSSESASESKSYKYKLELKVDSSEMERSKIRKTYEQDMEEALYTLQRRFIQAGMEDIKPTIDLENGELIFAYNGPKEMPKPMLMKLLGSGPKIGFYECYKAQDISSLIFSGAVKEYVVRKWIDEQNSVDVLLDSARIWVDHMEDYFPVIPALDFQVPSTQVSPQILYAKSKDTAKINVALKDPGLMNALGVFQDLELRWGMFPSEKGKDFYVLYALKTDFGAPFLSGAFIERVEEKVDQNTDQPIVEITLTQTGAEKFRELTAKNLQQFIAISVGDKVVTAPKVQEEISEGKVVISGNMTTEECAQLAMLLAKGELPISFHPKN